MEESLKANENTTLVDRNLENFLPLQDVTRQGGTP